MDLGIKLFQKRETEILFTLLLTTLLLPLNIESLNKNVYILSFTIEFKGKNILPVPWYIYIYQLYLPWYIWTPSDSSNKLDLIISAEIFWMLLSPHFLEFTRLIRWGVVVVWPYCYCWKKYSGARRSCCFYIWKLR